MLVSSFTNSRFSPWFWDKALSTAQHGTARDGVTNTLKSCQTEGGNFAAVRVHGVQAGPLAELAWSANRIQGFRIPTAKGGDWNTSYKNPQLVAQHCFDESFGSSWKKLLRKVERGSTLSNKFWLCCSFFIKLASCQWRNKFAHVAQRVEGFCISYFAANISFKSMV